jgi:proteic killer suppression protein
MAIQSFRDPRAKAIFDGVAPGKGFPSDLLRPAKRKLEMLQAAIVLDDLRVPPRATAWRRSRATGRDSIRSA